MDEKCVAANAADVASADACIANQKSWIAECEASVKQFDICVAQRAHEIAQPSPPAGTFVNKGFTAAEFTEYVRSLKIDAWRPQLIVVHNTGSPNLSQWHKVSGEVRMANLARFYYDELKRRGGPHIFVADDKIWVFNPLDRPGVHSPSWSKTSLGVEVVGDYEWEQFDDGVKSNTVSAIITLCRAFNIDPGQIKLHREDPLTTHACPGRNIRKLDLIDLVRDGLRRAPS